MKAKNASLISAGLLLLEAGTVTIPVFVLAQAFDFPAILRQPAREALTLFSQNQATIVPAYYLFLLSSLLYLPLSVALKNNLEERSVWGELMVVFGLATALFQAIGFSRWIILMPYLAEQYAVGNPATRETVALLYETINRYAGMTIGEHVGFLAMGGWTICVAMALPFSGWVRGAGVLIGGLLILSTQEQFGGAAAGWSTVNFLANTLWSLWLLVLLVCLLRPKALVEKNRSAVFQASVTGLH